MELDPSQNYVWELCLCPHPSDDDTGRDPRNPLFSMRHPFQSRLCAQTASMVIDLLTKAQVREWKDALERRDDSAIQRTAAFVALWLCELLVGELYHRFPTIDDILLSEMRELTQFLYSSTTVEPDSDSDDINLQLGIRMENESEAMQACRETEQLYKVHAEGSLNDMALARKLVAICHRLLANQSPELGDDEVIREFNFIVGQFEYRMNYLCDVYQTEQWSLISL